MSGRMKQYEAVAEVMKRNGGFATLGFLYEHVPKLPGVEWGTKTPFASIRRIVQVKKLFFKVRPGLWALSEYRNRLPNEIIPSNKASAAQKSEFNHSFYQGLIIEIGNLKKMQTFVPAQDRNRKYLNKNLGDIATLKDIYMFSHPYIVRRTRTVDVVWFNERKMPDSVFEVEHSTDIHNSLLKFVDLQDFRSRLFIVADQVRFREFQSKLSLSAFSPITERTRFLSYDDVSMWHTKTYELATVEGRINA
jgi:hypothetical protein